LRARCIIGTTQEERREKQDVIINLALWVDCRPAGRSDRLEDAVDYRALKKRLVAAVEASQFHLVEALAEHLADLCLQDGGVRKVQVTVDKLYALRFAQSVAVEITRERT